MESKGVFGADWDEDEDVAGDGGGDDYEFGFYRGGTEEYDSEEEEEEEEEEGEEKKDEGDGIAGILKNPNALTDSRYAADFEQLERLGQGGFGTVFKVRNRLDGRIYAVKRVLLSSKDKALSERVCKEVMCDV